MLTYKLQIWKIRSLIICVFQIFSAFIRLRNQTKNAKWAHLNITTLQKCYVIVPGVFFTFARVNPKEQRIIECLQRTCWSPDGTLSPISAEASILLIHDLRQINIFTEYMTLIAHR